MLPGVGVSAEDCSASLMARSKRSTDERLLSAVLLPGTPPASPGESSGDATVTSGENGAESCDLEALTALDSPGRPPPPPCSAPVAPSCSCGRTPACRAISPKLTIAPAGSGLSGG